jgi:hypothetical protein
LIVFLNVLNFYQKKDTTPHKICENSTNPSVKKINQKINEAITDSKTDVCSLILNKAAPAFCELKTHCNASKTEIDHAFAVFYVIQQLSRNHSTPFKCKDEQRKGENRVLR